jgi:hypothetical protein
LGTNQNPISSTALKIKEYFSPWCNNGEQQNFSNLVNNSRKLQLKLSVVRFISKETTTLITRSVGSVLSGRAEAIISLCIPRITRLLPCFTWANLLRAAAECTKSAPGAAHVLDGIICNASAALFRGACQ